MTYVYFVSTERSLQFLIENIIQENVRIVSTIFEVYKAVPTLVENGCGKIRVRTSWYSASSSLSVSWILGVFDTMAIVGNGCGKIRGGGNSLSLPSASNMLEREGGDLWLVIISE